MAYFNNLISTISLFYPSLRWKILNQDKIIYLTFDDGPIPGVTDFVLQQLRVFDAKATFFCVGENIKKNADHFLKIVISGHAYGNHTYNHVNGWNTNDQKYLDNVRQCQQEINHLQQARPDVFPDTTKRPLFRPPYGKIKRSQINSLIGEFDIIMWNVLTGDFDKKQTPENCLKEAIKYTSAGSIVIFHDSIKAEENLSYALPRFLEYFTNKGYRFESL